MNDYWNDPPEPLEPPECCGEMMEVDNAGNCLCFACGGFIKHEPDPDYDESLAPSYEPITDDGRMVNFPAKCRHGKEWFACDACDRESDFQYDCARERRMR